MARLTLILVLVVASTGCVHWPDAPYLDKASSLDNDAALQLQATHPGADLLTPVYRRHMELRPNEYTIVTQIFLFADAKQQTFRGEIESGRLTARSVAMLEALPDHLHRQVFEDPSASINGKHVVHRAWRYQIHQMNQEVSDPTLHEVTQYEFEFESGGRRGLGRIDADGETSSMMYLADAPDR